MKQVRVPQYPDETPYVCFKVRTSVPLHCLYYHEHSVDYRMVPSKEVGT